MSKHIFNAFQKIPLTIKTDKTNTNTLIRFRWINDLKTYPLNFDPASDEPFIDLTKIQFRVKDENRKMAVNGNRIFI